jgi:uncharacterized membrane protein
MNALKLGLSSLCILVAGFIGPGRAQQGTFVLAACNQSGEPLIYLAMVHRLNVNDNRFVARGWYPIQNGCAQARGIPKGHFYYFAFVPKEGGKQWRGTLNVCVNAKSNFQRVLTQNYTCKTGEEIIVPFVDVQVTQDAITVPFK